MKIFIKIAISLILGIFMQGCGSSESIVKPDVTIISKKSTLITGNKSLKMDLVLNNNYPSNVKVEIKDLRLSVEPCLIEYSSMTPSNVTFENQRNIEVTAQLFFKDTCIPTNYKLDGTSVLTLDGKTRRVPLISLSQELNGTILNNNTDVNGTTDINNEISYHFKNPTPIVVSEASEKRTISIDLIDTLGVGVSGKEVLMTTLESKFGSISSSRVTTDASGKASFSYTAPLNIDAVNNQKVNVEVIYAEESNYIKKEITISFKKKNSNTDTSFLYHFQNITPLVIKHDSQTEGITVNLVDKNGVGVSGKTVQITTLDIKYGSISSSTATTNGAGLATFSYTAPEDITSIDGKSTSVTIRFTENNRTIQTNVRISFTEISDNKDADTVLPIVVIENSLKTIELTSNSKSIAITMQVFKDSVPYSSGTVKVELPSKVLNGVDVGIFEAYEVPVDSRGIATFNYTGPANLKALMDNNDLSTVFKFYHTENSASETRQAVTVTYNLDEDSYVPINYVLEVTTPNNDFSMGIPNISKTFSVVLKDLKGQIINNDDIDISKIEVSTENALIAQIMNTTTGVTTNTLLLKNENNSAFTLVTNKLSGIVPLRINVEFKDINNELKKLSTIVNIRVMSGPPSAISISYVSTGIDASRAKYEEKFAISVTDEYGNKVNTKPFISVGAIVGYAVDGQEASSSESNETKRLYYGKSDIENDIANGTVNPLDDEIANTTNFEDDTLSRSEVFKYVNSEGVNSDKLVVFGQGKNYEAMGKWDFSKIDDNTLKLEDDYLGTLRSGLSYAIGRNYYQDQCADDGREWLGSTDAESYQLDEEGTVIISYKYDYHLTGKDALIWVNLSGYQSDTEKNTRIGEVSKHTLRGRGFEAVPTAGYNLVKGSANVDLTFQIHHKEVAEWYQNAKFSSPDYQTSCIVNHISSSNDYDARTCYSGGSGVTYITYNVSTPVDDEGKPLSCNFNIVNMENIVVANEF